MKPALIVVNSWKRKWIIFILISLSFDLSMYLSILVSLSFTLSLFSVWLFFSCFSPSILFFSTTIINFLFLLYFFSFYVFGHCRKWYDLRRSLFRKRSIGLSWCYHKDKWCQISPTISLFFGSVNYDPSLLIFSEYE